MDFVIILVVFLVLIIILKFVFGYNMIELRHLGENKELDEISKKYPDNIDLCKEYLKKLGNEKVKIEENKESEACLYIAITDKISIANIKDTYTRIQTIAHECLHSVQDRKLLLFNFFFSNIYLVYFVMICILAILKLLPYKMMFLSILMFLGLIYYMVRMYLENDAMIKARYLAKEYIDENKISTEEENKKLISSFDEINKKGIKCINYNLFLGIIEKAMIFCLICIIR